MDLANLKEILRSIAPLELLEKLKEALLSFWSKAFSLVKGGRSGDEGEDEPSPFARRKRLILFGLGGAAVLLFGVIIFAVIRNIAKPKNTDVFTISAGLSIPVEEFFFPPEPDFLPPFLPEREARRFWSLDDIRQYWRAPGDPDWWMGEIRSTVDSLMEGVQ